MKLLIFAHKAEARAFFDKFSFTAEESKFLNSLFKSENYYLLITGQGSQSATEKTAYILTLHHELIDEVYNIGVAGSLNQKYKKNDLLWIHKALGYRNQKLEFKSFLSYSKNTDCRCLSVDAPVYDINDRNKLSEFADIVDLELWSIASVSSFFKIPFYALKIVSDDHDSCETDVTKTVKNEASAFSKKLLFEFLNRKES